ncbi:hypothetical protein FD755_009440 [Muntiacus reevesi]|uniref:Dolichol-phosphate mannosyltransferase subunit 3 n=1 Tax=Muntiacus reevesi TaxID=9886 RepID=A0A5N3XV74_MUNRE|nr:hypothetical protein FD755_009440 [Muntiacus reevesi]
MALALLGSTGGPGPGAALLLPEVPWPLPIYVLVSADCYALGTVGHRVANLHGYEDAALELQNQIQDSGTDVTCKGMCF